jgi:hypothetical protein
MAIGSRRDRPGANGGERVAWVLARFTSGGPPPQSARHPPRNANARSLARYRGPSDSSPPPTRQSCAASAWTKKKPPEYPLHPKIGHATMAHWSIPWSVGGSLPPLCWSCLIQLQTAFRVGAMAEEPYRTARRLFISAIALGFVSAILLCVSAVSARPAHKCGRIDWDYPGGLGGASGLRIRAVNISCPDARRVVRACVHGRPKHGWRVRVVADRSPWHEHVLLTSGPRRITYHEAGGGDHCGLLK